MIREEKLRIATLSPDVDFLRELAKLVLRGYPLEASGAQHLHTWTILVPTRRSARRLQGLLFEESGSKALLLPRIQPIGDLDEDLMVASGNHVELPDALSPTARLFALIGFIADWAAQNPHSQLAADLQRSATQAQALAVSLGQLLDHFEEEGLVLESLVALYDIDLAFHREAVLGLLDVLRVKLPTLLHDRGLVDARVRRNHLIRLEAQRIANGQLAGPIIAAGSTGTISATRELLKAIAGHPQGSVILPGLDLAMDEDDWNAVDGQHPQYAMKRLLGSFEIGRDQVVDLQTKKTPRNWLLREVMRTSETTDQWQMKLHGQADVGGEAMQGVTMIAAADRQTEAKSIALILREALETPGQTAALITPDRELARRVKGELARWEIAIDDTAGEPLIRFGAASLLLLIIRVVQDQFSPASLVSLFSHADCRFEFSRDDFKRIAENFEIGILRQQSVGAGLDGLAQTFQRISAARKLNHRLPLLARSLPPEAWDEIEHLIGSLRTILQPLTKPIDESLDVHLSALRATINSLAPGIDWNSPEHQQLSDVLDQLQTESEFFPIGDFAKAAEVICYCLRAELFRTQSDGHPRLSIMGLLEARLMRPDVVVLGGLNEGRWPAQPDPGPWLNRPMRDRLGLQQPEREIGQTAHDFVQAAGNHKVYLTWSARIDHAPVLPSRWILRLGTILRSLGRPLEKQHDTYWSDLAMRLDVPEHVRPHARPLPTPAVNFRPTHFSVTEIEKLTRDPYAIYAKKILRLEAVGGLGEEPDAALRGQLFHAAIGLWNEGRPYLSETEANQALMTCGENVFAPFRNDLEIMQFWWPRFLRVAEWLSQQEAEFNGTVEHSFSEIKGLLKFDVAGVDHTLSARADRLDILQDGTLRVLDYKTGAIPSIKQVKLGFSPQLTLQAAMAANGAFENVPPISTSELRYVHISGGNPPGKIANLRDVPKDGFAVMVKSLEHLSGLKTLLGHYQMPTVSYVPRLAVEKEDDETDFDHLSRYLEWSLVGPT
jgi:ATP-dependent helicase/nuclease subunit B